MLRAKLRPPAKPTPPATPARRASHGSPYAAVQIVPGLLACTAVNEFRDRTFLAKSAPPLPVEGCRESECSCRYRRLPDRRADHDRRSPLRTVDGSWHMAAITEKRRGSDRRRQQTKSRPRSYFNDHD